MAIDAAIPLSAHAAPVESPVDQYAKVLGMQQAINGSRLSSLQIRSMETELGKQARIDARLKALGPGAAIGDVAGAYLGEGDAKTGAALLQNDAAVKSSNARTDLAKEQTLGARTENTTKALDAFGQRMQGVTDDASQQAAITEMLGSGDPYLQKIAGSYAQQHPRFDKDVVAQAIQGTKAAQQAIANHVAAAGKTEPLPEDVLAQQERLKRAGATQVSTYGSPVAAVDRATGEPVLIQPDNRGGDPRVLRDVAPAPKAQLTTAKDVNTAKGKIMAAENLKRQIAIARQKFALASKDTATTGIVGGYNPLSESGQSFDASIDALRGSVTALTRVPGIGSMSDWEGRIDQAKLPKRSQYDNVTKQKLDELEALADGVISGYTDMLGPQQPAQPTDPGIKTPDGTHIDSTRPPASLPPVNDKGFKLMRDANGNQAYVGPNGEVEEVR